MGLVMLISKYRAKYPDFYFKKDYSIQTFIIYVSLFPKVDC